MTKKLIGVFTGLGLALGFLNAQTLPPANVAPETTASVPAASPLSAQLFYQLLIGELSAGNGDAGAAVSLLLDAAKKTNDAQLYQRATELALQARSGDAALQAARAWRQAQPKSLQANRFVLQILLALNRIAATAEPLKSLLELTAPADRAQALSSLPDLYARAGDKKLASAVGEQALSAYFNDSTLAAQAWASAGRLRLAAGETASALDAARKSLLADPRSRSAALLALELMDPKTPQAEALFQKYLDGAAPVPGEMRLAYARALLESQRLAEGNAQLVLSTREQPDFPDSWLILGTVQLQENQPSPAEASFKRYIALAQAQGASELPENRQRGLAQAYLSLAQIAEKRSDLPAAEAWLNQITNAEVLVQAQTRRASLLARQGKLAEGRQLLRQIPERSDADARLKLMAEVGLLRDFKQFQEAHDLLAEAAAESPDDVDMLYEQAMLAEKLSRLSDMERLLRRVIALKPDYSAAYNALGYSLAERGLRLPEAKQLIQKAIELVPGDPYIQDSLGWVEFRMGNLAEAVRILEAAFKAKPDAEIAAHFGEVLWSQGQRSRAIAVWKEGQLLAPDNETLLETLKRLNAKL